jgi:ethanolamine utilization microcompartment shell protein EutS
MAGTDDLNAQGIRKSADVRQAFTLAWPGMILCGGDFDSFEITLADAVFGDERLRKDLLSGLSIHTVMSQQLYPDKTFEQILASKSLKDGGIIDYYVKGKQAVFAMLYGGDETTINKKLSIKMKIAVAAFDGFQNRYPGIRAARELNAKLFGAMEQSGGIGTKILWNEPRDFCETFLGFRRYFVLENEICKILFDMGQTPPKHWKLFTADAFGIGAHELTCNRRDRQQTLSGAASSALYGAAFQLQAANVRAANNHLIQSPGAMITKALQVAIWSLQPSGVHDWVVAPFQVHDEVNVVADPSVTDKLAEVVRESVESYRDKVPLIALKWDTGLASWGDESFKDDDPRRIHIQPDMVIEDRDDPEADLPSLELSSEEWEEVIDDD